MEFFFFLPCVFWIHSSLLQLLIELTIQLQGCHPVQPWAAPFTISQTKRRKYHILLNLLGFDFDMFYATWDVCTSSIIYSVIGFVT